MSGIFGIVNLEGEVNRADLEKMSVRLSHRGSDAHNIWISYDGRVGLGHRMRWTVPENMHESLPYEDEEGYAITADARLDNRQELQELLGWKHLDLEKLGDSRLILGVYKKWGDQSPEKLKGDFVYVIWDPVKEKLIVGRDYFGVKPLFFYQQGDLFCFASEIKGLLELNFVLASINQVEIEHYLQDLSYNGVPLEATFYEKIYRILPAHSYYFSRQEKTKDYYGQRLWDSIEINVKQEDLPREFRRVFQESIDQRIRCIGEVGSQLSGGLDSSSVSLMAAESLKKESKTLYTAYANSNFASSDESIYVQDVLDASDNMEHTSVEMLHPIQSLEHFSDLFDEPLRMPCTSVNHATLQAFYLNNVKVALSGHDGDSIVGFGHTYVYDLLDQCRLTEFSKEITNYSQYYSELPHSIYPPRTLLFEELVAFVFIRRRVISDLRKLRLLDTIKNLRLSKDLGFSVKDWFNATLLIFSLYSDKSKSTKTLSFSDFIYENKSNYQETYQWSHPMLISGEEADQMNQKFNLELRHPFLNVELFQLALNFDQELNYFYGLGRGLLRQALKHVLPKSVFQRSSKADFSEFIFSSLNVQNGEVGYSKNQYKAVIQYERNKKSRLKKVKSVYFKKFIESLKSKNNEKEIFCTEN